MQIHRARLLPLLLILMTCSLAAAQTPAPPVKMGLWQSETNTSVDGASSTPMAQAMTHGGRTTIVQGCLTPESWKDDIQGMQQRHSAGCTVSNFQQDSRKFSFDEKCSADQSYSSNIHFEMLIDDTENAHGHADITTSGPAFPEGMTMHMTMKTKFLSSDCGSVKPGEGKIIQ